MVDEESIKYAIIKKSLFLVIDDSLKNVGIYWLISYLFSNAEMEVWFSNQYVCLRLINLENIWKFFQLN